MTADGQETIYQMITDRITPRWRRASSPGVTVTLEVYPFSATVPAEPKYGITSGSLPVYYVTERQFENGIDLSC